MVPAMRRQVAALIALLLPIVCRAFTIAPRVVNGRAVAVETSLYSVEDYGRFEGGRRSFLRTIGISTASVIASSLQPASAEEGTKVLVLGGTGLVGSRVVEKLKSLGIDVIATSRDGRDGTVAFDVTTANVPTTVEELSKGCSAVISTIGVIGTPDDGVVNGATGLASNGAKAAGVQNFVYISVAPEVRSFAKDLDFLQNYLKGKSFSEGSIVHDFAERSYTLIEPTFIYGGEAFGLNPPRVSGGYGKLVEGLLSSGPFRAATNVAPEGFVKIALEPPVSAEAVAAAAVAGALGKTDRVLDTHDKIKEAANTI